MNRQRNILIITICFAMTGCQTTGHQSIKTHNQTSTVSLAKEPREIYATNVSYNAETGKLKYTLPEPALVRLRIGVKGDGPLLRSLLDWEERSAGDHIEVWDGKDDTGLVNFGQRSDVMLVLMCIAQNPAERQSVAKGFRSEPKFFLSFPGSGSKDNVTVLKGTALFRVALDETDKTWLSEAKYELAVYVDGVFLMEDEEGINPFNYKLDTTKMNPGKHTITVN